MDIYIKNVGLESIGQMMGISKQLYILINSTDTINYLRSRERVPHPNYIHIGVFKHNGNSYECNFKTFMLTYYLWVLNGAMIKKISLGMSLDARIINSIRLGCDMNKIVDIFNRMSVESRRDMVINNIIHRNKCDVISTMIDHEIIKDSVNVRSSIKVDTLRLLTKHKLVEPLCPKTLFMVWSNNTRHSYHTLCQELGVAVLTHDKILTYMGNMPDYTVCKFIGYLLKTTDEFANDVLEVYVRTQQHHLSLHQIIKNQMIDVYRMVNAAIVSGNVSMAQWLMDTVDIDGIQLLTYINTHNSYIIPDITNMITFPDKMRVSMCVWLGYYAYPADFMRLYTHGMYLEIMNVSIRMGVWDIVYINVQSFYD